jgi:hypothetical protein
VNNFAIPVSLIWIDLGGDHQELAIIPPRGQSSIGLTYTGDYFLVNSGLTGAFMCVFSTAAGGGTYPVDCSWVVDVGDIGPIPQPNRSVIIPPDSPRVLVACGAAPNGNWVVREQYWERQPDSYCLAPGETKAISMSTTSGMQQTSSQQMEIAASLGLSASADGDPYQPVCRRA